MSKRAALRKVADPDAEAKLLEALRARKGEATGADLEVATGLGKDLVERSMTRLLDLYESKLAVASGGGLVYRFDPRFHRRPERRAALRAALAATAAVVRAGAAAVRVAFQVVLAVQLLVYTFIVTLPVAAVVGAVVGIVGLVMAIFSKDGGDIIMAIFSSPVVACIVLAAFLLGGIGWVIYREYELVMGVFTGKGRRQGPKIAGAIACVNDFALGPRLVVPADERTDRTMRISLADERIVLARVRAAGGRLRSGDLVRWLGLDLDEADRQATRIAVEHDGSPAIDDLSVIEFEFEGLLEGSAKKDPKGKTAFERGETPPSHTGNEAGQDLLIIGFAAVNLVAGYVGLHELQRPGTLWAVGHVLGGYLPIAFSIFLLGVWAARWPFTWVRLARARRRAARAELLQKIVGHCDERGDALLDLDDDERELALALGGETDLPDLEKAQRMGWRFPRLLAELAPKAGAPKKVLAAKVVYES